VPRMDVDSDVKASRTDLFARRFSSRRYGKRNIFARLKERYKAKRAAGSSSFHVDYYDHGIVQHLRRERYLAKSSRSATQLKHPTVYANSTSAYNMATMPLTNAEADAIASRARVEARKLVGADGQLVMQEVMSMLRCSSMQLTRSILSHLPYQLLVDLKKSDYGRHIGLDNRYPVITGDVLNSALLAADQRERVFWLKRAAPSETDVCTFAFERITDGVIPPPPLNPNASRAVRVFEESGSLSNRHWFERRALDREEAEHPSIRSIPSIQQARAVHHMAPRHGRLEALSLAVVNSFDHFDMNLWAFSHGILQGVLGNGAVIGGSAVMAAMVAPERNVQTALERRAAVERICRRFLRNSEACMQKVLEYMGDCDVSLSNLFDGRNSPYCSADLDIFFVADSKAAAAERLVVAMKRIVCNMRAYGSVSVVETPNAFTVCGAWPLRHVQLVTHVRESVDELFSFADMDCTALAFDGRHVWMAPRAVRAFATGYNFVTPRMLAKRQSTAQRAAKYARRGFGMLTFELCKHMPRCDVKVDKEVSAALARAREMVAQKAAPPGPQDIASLLKRCQARETDVAATGAAVAKVMRRMQRAGGSILPRGPGIGGSAVQAYVDMLPFLVEAGLLRSPPLAAVALESAESAVLKKLVWHRQTNSPWVDWGMVPSAPWTRKPGSTCYQCRGPLVEQVASASETTLGSDASSSTRVRICSLCESLNASKRNRSMDLLGMTAIVTGGRTKIGYETAVRLLQCGALVVVTTRFPHQAARRFAKDVRTSSSTDRLHVYGIDFRHLQSMTDFCDHVLEHYPIIDIIVHNAAQTIRRPPAYYRELFEEEQRLVECPFSEVSEIVKHVGIDPHRLEKDEDLLSHIMSKETAVAHRLRNKAKRTMALELSCSSPLDSVPSHVAELLRRAQTAVEETKASGIKSDPVAALFSSALAVVPLLPSDRDAELQKEELFPASLRDIHGEPLDLRTSTSWTAPLDNVPLLELMEVLVVNSVAPFLLTSRLLPGLRGAAASSKGYGGAFVVNVSSSEGMFDASKPKGSEHPHTNMGKAALNMLTRTIANDLASQNVFVTSADTGWISQMRPNPKVLPPLSEEDGAARVLDPVLSGIDALKKGEVPSHGVLFQHFKVVDW